MQELLSFGPWLKQRRRALDLTQEELAQRAACSLSTLRKIEAGGLLPSKELARLLAIALGVSTAEQEAFIAFAREERRSALAAAFAPPTGLSLLAQSQAAPRLGATARRHALPTQLTPLIGRATEMVAVQSLLARSDCTLLTIIGPGGIGKTRLALAVAHAVATADPPPRKPYPDGIYFVAFVGVTAPDYMVSTIATALGFAFASDGDPQTQLLNYLATKAMLLIFDNLEHLLDGAGLIVELLQAAPALKVLVTSRERLAVAGEWTFDLPALATPPTVAEALSTARLAEYPAVDLFVERAQRTHYRFALSAENGTAVAQICRLVGGMPLGVELAASWVHTLSCAEIAQEIEQNLDFLAVNHRNLPERQRSVRATFDHSWRLLSAAERQVLRRLSVFRGGFQREAATAVAGATLPLLASLVSKSLIRRTDEGRYDLHELVRQYAADHLSHDPQGEAQTRHAHADHFLGNLDDHAGLFNHQHAAMRRLLLREKENLRVAWLWSAEQGRYDLLQRAMHTFWLFHEVCFLLHEGRLLFSQALQAVTTAGAVGEAAGTPAAVVQHELQAQQGWFLFRTGQFAEARPILEKQWPIYANSMPPLP